MFFSCAVCLLVLAPAAYMGSAKPLANPTAVVFIRCPSDASKICLKGVIKLFIYTLFRRGFFKCDYILHTITKGIIYWLWLSGFKKKFTVKGQDYY